MQKRIFTVERMANAAFTGHKGPRSLARAYRKYGVPLPRGLVDALEFQELERRSGAAAAEPPSRQDEPAGLMARLGGRVSLAGTIRDGELLQPRGTPVDAVDGAPRREGGRGGGAGDVAPGQSIGQDAAQPAGKQTGGQQQQGSPRPGSTGSRYAGLVGAVVAQPEGNDTEYLSPVVVGGQTLNVNFDTGSSDFWVFSTMLPAQSQTGHRVYDPARSRAARALAGQQFRISYGDGSRAQGTVGTDDVSVGGVTMRGQPVQLATQVTPQFMQDQNSDGIMGFAFEKLNTVKPDKQPTFLDNVMGSLAEPVLVADLRRNATYTLGGFDPSRFQGKLTTIPVNDTRGFWQFSSEAFAVGDGQRQPATPGAQAIADTGTSLILADKAIVQGYYSQVRGAAFDTLLAGVTFPCDARLPDLTLAIGSSYMARVAGVNINFAPTGTGRESLFARPLFLVPPLSLFFFFLLLFLLREPWTSAAGGG